MNIAKVVPNTIMLMLCCSWTMLSKF